MIDLVLNETHIEIGKNAFEAMAYYIQSDNKKPEAGGILLGHYFDECSFQIVEVSLPSKYDRASRYSFVRCRKNAQRIITKHFDESKGKIIYLGEWHTHPEDMPSPSVLDKKSIKERLLKDELNSDVIFTLILGRKGFYIAAVNKNGIYEEKIFNYQEIELK